VVGVKYVYSTYTNDSDGDSVRYEFNWGDGSKNMTGWIDSGKEIGVYHSWKKEGTYKVRVRAFDGISWSEWSEELKVVVKNSSESSNSPPDRPILLSGKKLIYTNRSCSFIFSCTDPDNDLLQMMIDWGDGTNSGWSGFKPSNSSFSFSHIWTEEGMFVIRAIAKDDKNESSGWTEILTIQVVSSIDEDKDGVPNDVDPLPKDPYNVETLSIDGKILYIVRDDRGGIAGIYSAYQKKFSNIRKDGSKILLDINDDGRWEYIYDLLNGKVYPYEESAPNWWIFIISIALIVTILASYHVRQRLNTYVVKRFRCPNCGFEVEMKGKKGQKIKMGCPKCKTEGTLKF